MVMAQNVAPYVAFLFMKTQRKLNVSNAIIIIVIILKLLLQTTDDIAKGFIIIFRPFILVPFFHCVPKKGG